MGIETGDRKGFAREILEQFSDQLMILRLEFYLLIIASFLG
jgi:hypothetical protein